MQNDYHSIEEVVKILRASVCVGGGGGEGIASHIAMLRRRTGRQDPQGQDCL